MADDFPAELERAYARIEELESEAVEMQRNLRNYMNIAWWRTYNAAVTGCSTVPEMTVDSVHKWASELANVAHGPIDGRPR